MKNNVRNLLRRQAPFEQRLHRSQEVNDEKIFPLGTEIADTQKSVKVLRDVIDARLSATGETLRQLNSQLSNMSICMSIQRQFELILGKVHTYTSYMDIAYTDLKIYRASFVSHNISMLAQCPSFFGFIPPSFLTSNQPSANVKDLTAEEIQRVTKLTPSI